MAKKVKEIIQQYRLVNNDILMNCMENIRNEYFERRDDKKAKPLCVILANEGEQRTNAQNRLMWVWYTAIGKQRGMTKEQVHNEMRATFLLPIYCMHDPVYEEIASDRLKGKVGNDEWVEKLKLAHICSTKSASIDMLSSYLKEIEMWAYANGIYLSIPDDLKWCK